jgi:hypothetical protein
VSINVQGRPDALVGPAGAQSTELDRRTRLIATEASASFDRPVVHYYAFEAGPGEFTLLSAALLTDGGIFAAGNIWFYVLDGNLKEVDSVNLSLGDAEQQKLTRYTLTRKSAVVLEVEVGTFAFSKGGRYRFRLGGAVNIGAAPAALAPAVPPTAIASVVPPPQAPLSPAAFKSVSCSMMMPTHAAARASGTSGSCPSLGIGSDGMRSPRRLTRRSVGS